MNVYEFAYTVPGDDEKPSIRLGMIQADNKARAKRLLEEHHDYIDVHVLRYWRSSNEGDYPANTGHKLFRQREKNIYA